MLKNIYNSLITSNIPAKKRAKKLGTLDIGVVEATPVVWNGRLLRFEWFRPNRNEYMEASERTDSCYRFVDMESGEKTPDFAFDHSFGCCYVKDGKMYVHGTRGGGGAHFLDTFVSEDLIHWEQTTALEFPDDVGLFNTSVCRGKDSYIMAIEIGGSNPIVGAPFTIVFAESDDLINWKLLPWEEHIYDRSRYTACPVIRYYDGYYYMIYLEAAPHHRWLPYIVRSSDLREFELGLTCPIMYPDDDDKKVIHPEKFTAAQLDYINNAVDCNNSDYDTCEWNGKTVILYSWGNQLGKEFLAMAEYDGSEQEYLESFFAS